MEPDDEEFEQLLDEIPRATSAPPHLEELQRVYGAQLDGGLVLQAGPDESPVAKPFADIRADELYDTFYRTYSGGKKLPPPIEGGQSGGASGVFSPKSAQLSPFYSGLDLDSPRLAGHMAHRQQHALGRRPTHADGQDREQVARASAQQEERERPLASSFSALSLGDASPSRDPSNRYGPVGGTSPVTDTTRGQVGQGGHSEGRVHGLNGGPLGIDGYSSGGSSAGLNGFGSSSSLDRYATKASMGLEMLPPKRSSPSMDGLGQRSSTPVSDGHQSTSGAMIDQYLRRRVPSAVELYTTGRASAGASLDSYSVVQAAAEAYQNAAAMHQASARLGYPLTGGGSQSNLEAYAAAAAAQVGQGGMPALPLDYDMAVYIQAQHRANQMAVLQAQLRQDEERLRQRVAQQQQLLAQAQQQQAAAAAVAAAAAQEQQGRLFYPGGQGLARALSPPRARGSNGSSSMLAPHPLKHRSASAGGLDASWGGQGAGPAPVDPRSPVLPGGICRYFVQGYCSRGDVCPFLHTLPVAGMGYRGDAGLPLGQSLGPLAKDSRGPHQALRAEGRYQPSGPLLDKLALARQMRPGSMSPRRKSEGSLHLLSGSGGLDVSNGHLYHPHSRSPHQPSAVPDEYDFDRGGGSLQHSHSGGSHLMQLGQQPKYTTLEEVEGRIYQIAKDQHGCRFLQKKFDEGGPEDVEKIFREIIDHIVELMTDPFGNYLIQKLLECCSEYQRRLVLDRVAQGAELVTISLNMHGTRAVQKLIETLTSGDQVALVISALKPGVVTLIKDLNGNHVIQRCLQRLSKEDNQFIFDAAAAHCVEIATHRHGCCVLQRCVDFASGPQRQRLVAEIAANALVLSQDPFGNYVVQYILDLGMPWASVEVMCRLEGNYPYLAMQKFSSNVVEKCLKLAGEANRNIIVRELIQSPRLGHLLQDPYANYVVQSALAVSKGALHAGLVDAIRPHLPALRSSPYGKRILSRTNLKK